MMNLIKQEIKNKENISVTENGAVGYKTTGKALVDINYQVSSLRHSNEDEIIKLFDAAFEENKEYALKWLFFARDIRGGLGERRLFRVCYKRLSELDIDLFNENLDNIPTYGRWDDLITLIGLNDSIDSRIAGIIATQLAVDISNMEDNQPISLLAKWLPSENASSKHTKKMAKRIRELLCFSSKEYRKLLSSLRAHIGVVETQMCNHQWNKIDYNKVPSLANLKYSNAFKRHDSLRRQEYLNSVQRGESKMNMSTATPVDIVAKYGALRLNPYDQALELAWQNLTDVMVEDTLVVADGSGSMTFPISGTTTALDVANALAIYTSEHNSGIYKNKYITFSSKPRFVEFSDNNSLIEKLHIARQFKEISNTNIEAVFDLILDIAISNEISKEEMIKNILIISDMEFDEAQNYGWFKETNPLTQPLFDSIRQRYEEAGYLLPKLIFWNVNSRTKTIPLTENELGVVLCSGFSQNVLKMMMSNNLDPYNILLETLNSERYDAIICH